MADLLLNHSRFELDWSTGIFDDDSNSSSSSTGVSFSRPNLGFCRMRVIVMTDQEVDVHEPKPASELGRVLISYTLI